MNWILGISISKVYWTCFVAGGLQFGGVGNLEVFTRAKSKVCQKEIALGVCHLDVFLLVEQK
jgi:hypothetical protein